MTIKTRFPPSPTGFLHVGSLRTALYNYYFAKKHGGTFALRVEDTDRTRYVDGAVESLIRTLDRMGIEYDEGPIIQNGQIGEKGENGPYVQSQRLDRYQKAAQDLLQAGHAYYCFCPKERLEELRSIQQAAKRPTKYDRLCLSLTDEEIKSRLDAGESHVIRMKIPEGKTTFQDEIRGAVTFDHEEMDDQVLLKADGFPTYHLAVVVDDHAMGVTHIIRGEEWLSSVPKHVLLYTWFGYPMPVFAHLPLILNPDKSKLSKRQGDVAVEDFLAKGYLEDALVNFVSLLGFNPSGDREIYTRAELIEAFDLKKVNKSGAVFDVAKLNWMNSHYLKELTSPQLADRVRLLVKGAGEIPADVLERVCAVEKPRLTVVTDVASVLPMYTTQPNYDVALLVWKKSDAADAKLQLSQLRAFLTELPEATFASLVLLDEALKRYISERALQNGPVLWPLRVALSGTERSAGPHELAWVLQQEETLRRIDHAIRLFN